MGYSNHFSQLGCNKINKLRVYNWLVGWLVSTERRLCQEKGAMLQRKSVFKIVTLTGILMTPPL